MNLHVTSGGNHNTIMVETFNALSNKVLRIFCSERDTTICFVKGAQILAYAWNLVTRAEIDMSRSLVVVGREFQFLIDFIENYINMDITSLNKNQYAMDLKHRLTKCREVYKVLIAEYRNMHREYTNTCRPDPFA